MVGIKKIPSYNADYIKVDKTLDLNELFQNFIPVGKGFIRLIENKASLD